MSKMPAKFDNKGTVFLLPKTWSLISTVDVDVKLTAILRALFSHPVLEGNPAGHANCFVCYNVASAMKT